MTAPEAHPADALLRPSAAHRWMRCAASPSMEARYPNTTNEYAAEGTAAHFLGEQCLKRVLEPGDFLGQTVYVKDSAAWFEREDGSIPEEWHYTFNVTPEMAHAVDQYVTYVRELPGDLFVEHKADLSGLLPNDGTADAVKADWANDTLYITDLKYGKGKRVFAEHNEQLMLYALGIKRAFDLLGGFERFVLTIHQPRINHVDPWETSATDLEEFAGKVAESVALAKSDNPPFVAGGHCRFCRFKNDCRTFGEKAVKAVTGEFEDLTQWTVPEVGQQSYTAEEVSAMLGRVSLVREWIAAVEAKAYDLLESGQALPGWKLVQGRKGNRTFADEDEVRARCRKMKLKVGEYMPPKLASVAQLEKLVGKDKFQKKFHDLVHQSEGKPTLAPESDSRPAYNPAEGFEDVSESAAVLD